MARRRLKKARRSAAKRGCLPAPFEERHSSWGLEKPWLCGVCLQLHHSLLLPGRARGKSEHPTGHQQDRTSPSHHCCHIGRLKQIQFHNTEGRLQSLVDLRCLNLLYSLKINASLNLATNSYTSVIINSAIRDQMLSACEVTNVSPKDIIHPKVISILESYRFSHLSNAF